MIPRAALLSYLAVGVLTAANALVTPAAFWRAPTDVTRAVPCEVPSVAEPAINLVGLLFAVTLVAWSLRRSRGVIHWRSAPQAAVPRWTPRSWNSNLAVGGALLSALLGVSALPLTTCFLPRASYAVLNLTFSAFVALAPAVYGLLKADSAPTPKSAFRLFAFAAAITTWGTLGQLCMAACLFLELTRGHVIGWSSAGASILVLAGVAAAVMVYTFRCVAGYFRPSPPDEPPTTPDTRAREPREWALV